jgi:hypothetical protein
MVALSIAGACFVLAVRAAGGTAAQRREGPPVMYVIFGLVAFLGAVGDLRLLPGGPLPGARRLARHLWRMCFALFVAAGSFFLGPPRRLPAPIRGAGWLPLPVLLVIAVMFYWLARVKVLNRPPRLAARA